MRNTLMEIKIGIQNLPREVVLSSDATAAEIEVGLATALTDGTVFRVSDAKGRIVLIPPAAIAYLDIDQEQTRQVGFGHM
jgi:hypothetical protein